MSILSSIGRIATELSAARARYQTERAIRSLPIELQKDIGWPEVADIKTGTRYGVGSWAGGAK
jgi:DNA-binding transcriptional regulator YdaS (Cro superfamily)